MAAGLRSFWLEVSCKGGHGLCGGALQQLQLRGSATGGAHDLHGISLIPRSARPEASIPAAAITAAVAPAAAQAAVDMPEAGHLILQDEVHSCTS